ncbi:MAG TPA: NAD-binding protein, partial [Anaerolineaceae bacterium]|nr:NAD-binding protein [Anaerolineaceae bacterium]
MPEPVPGYNDEPCIDEKDKKQKAMHFGRVLADARFPILILLGLAALTLGIIGFQRYFNQTGEQKSFATAVYNAIWLFTIEPGNLIEPIPWELEIARWLAPAIAMYGILLGFAAIFRDQVRLFGLRFFRNHAIICGLGEKGLHLVRDFRRNGYEVVVIEHDGNNPNIASSRELGAIVLTGDARDVYLLNKAGVNRAKYLIAVCGADGVNSDVAVITRRLVTRRAGSKLNCSIHIKDPDLWVLLRKQEFSARENQGMRLDIFNIYDQGAKQLFREFPISAEPEEITRVPHLLIIGLGDFAEQLILNVARRWSPHHDATQQKIHISLVDPGADAFIEKVCQEYSLVNHVCDWECLSFDTSSIEFLKAGFLMDAQKQVNVSAVYVMVEDEGIGLRASLMLLERMKPTPVRILVRMSEEKGLASLIRDSSKNTGVFERLFFFGLMERTCKMNLVFNSSHEAISRAIHEEYLRREAAKGHLPGSSPVLVDWD